MSNVRFVFPILKLEKLIRAAGGLTVADALAQADANLGELKPSCHAELLHLLDEAEATFAALGPETSEQDLSDLYAIAVAGIGAGSVSGVPDVDAALGSFCDLVDALQTSGQRDKAPIRVHLNAWRLMMDPNLPRPGAAAILEGLRKVSGRYAHSAAPQGSG